jgi:hypothetical protein
MKMVLRQYPKQPEPAMASLKDAVARYRTLLDYYADQKLTPGMVNRLRGAIIFQVPQCLRDAGPAVTYQEAERIRRQMLYYFTGAASMKDLSNAQLLALYDLMFEQRIDLFGQTVYAPRDGVIHIILEAARAAAVKGFDGISLDGVL